MAGQAETREAVVHAYDRPVLFYSLATILPWGFWAVAGAFSRAEPASRTSLDLTSAFGLLGLLSPMIVAFWLISALPDCAPIFAGVGSTFPPPRRSITFWPHS